VRTGSLIENDDWMAEGPSGFDSPRRRESRVTASRVERAETAARRCEPRSESTYLSMTWAVGARYLTFWTARFALSRVT
jgi:hypothetical protein